MVESQHGMGNRIRPVGRGQLMKHLAVLLRRSQAHGFVAKRRQYAAERAILAADGIQQHVAPDGHGRLARHAFSKACGSSNRAPGFSVTASPYSEPL